MASEPGAVTALRGAVLLAGRFQEDAVIEVAAGRIVRCGSGFAPTGPTEEWGASRIVPGFLDTHVHGALGHDFTDPDPGCTGTIARHLLSRGTTGFMATVLSSGRTGVEEALANLECFRASAPIAQALLGVHFEGPFLNVERRGAHPADELLPPDLAVAERYLESLPRELQKSFTLAPELPGAFELIDFLVSGRAVVALGHSKASYDVARKAMDRGARHATHLFNAMGPLHHREPGVIGAFLDARDTTMELIPDGIHVHPALLRLALAAAGPERIVGVTDAASVAGLPPGRYRWRDAEIAVRLEGGAYLAGGLLAGSVIDVPAALGVLVAAGVPLAGAIAMFTENPARLLGLERERGRIAPGMRADLVILGEDLAPCATYLGGARVSRALQGVPAPDSS